MKLVLLGTLDRLTSTLCSVGPLRPVGAWWWKKRLAPVLERLEMEQYERRR